MGVAMERKREDVSGSFRNSSTECLGLADKMAIGHLLGGKWGKGMVEGSRVGV